MLVTGGCLVAVNPVIIRGGIFITKSEYNGTINALPPPPHPSPNPSSSPPPPQLPSLTWSPLVLRSSRGLLLLYLTVPVSLSLVPQWVGLVPLLTLEHHLGQRPETTGV